VPEFSTGVIEALRQSLEERVVVRAPGTVAFPDRFQLSLRNPCRSGLSVTPS